MIKVWEVYDFDGNGVLDKEETRSFIRDYMTSINRANYFSDLSFDNLFEAHFDDDNSGEIDQDEMVELIKIICNNINTRWGGLPEQVAITEILNIRLDVYEIVKLDTTKLKMISCTTKSKDHRFKKIASLNVNSNNICNLLFENMSSPNYSLKNI